MATTYANELGAMVEFRDNSTEDLLWTTLLFHIPRIDDVVKYGLMGDGLTTYEVKRVTWEFRKPIPLVEDPPIELAVVHCSQLPTVYVELVP